MILNRQKGFTIVELLIVIVVIGIISTITTIAYNGIQERGRQLKIEADLMQLHQAIHAARINSGEVALRYVTGSVGTANDCVQRPTVEDLTDKIVSADCWAAYATTLDAISNAGGINVRGLIDPWGRPYFIDENEREGAGPCGAHGQDSTGTYHRPRTQGDWTNADWQPISYITPGC
jgi:prepilin-type N-terminal cleavage/methylation domain-containing protein